MRKAAANGKPLPTQISVSQSVTAQAVLIPAHDARRIFGKEIGDRYAVIEVNLGNKSPDAALIVHGIFIDYSNWALSGSLPRGQATTVEGMQQQDPFARFQSSTRPSQVASEEYRVVRGQFLNAQTWRPRNKILRLATLAGNIAGAYTFSIKELGFIKGIAAFNGVIVPGLDTAWPDTSLDQLNRINDFGFQTNKVIAKQSAEVIVCFFPIDRFLTPGFAKLFRKSPALFFAPLQMLVDKSLDKEVDKVLGEDLGLKAEDIGGKTGEKVRDILRKNLPCYLRIMDEVKAPTPANNSTLFGQVNRTAYVGCLGKFGLREETNARGVPVGLRLVDGGDATRKDSEAQFATFVALDYLSQVSLNNVGVTVDGAMTVDTTAIGAKIDGVTIDRVANCGGIDRECFWSVPPGGSVVRTATIDGSYLTGGAVEIAEANELKITDVQTVTDGSSDQRLKVSFKLTETVPSGRRLTFTVTKPKVGSTDTLDSQPWAVGVSYGFTTPHVFNTEYEDGVLTITGAGFTPGGVAVDLEPPDGETLSNVTLTTNTAEKVVLTVPPDKRAGGCWEAVVTVNGRKAEARPSDEDSFIIPPSPKLKTAKVNGDSIDVTGTDLVGTDNCGGDALTFQLINKAQNATRKTLDVEFDPEELTATGGKLKLPADAKEGDWTLKATLGNDKSTQVNLDK